MLSLAFSRGEYIAGGLIQFDSVCFILETCCCSTITVGPMSSAGNITMTRRFFLWCHRHALICWVFICPYSSYCLVFLSNIYTGRQSTGTSEYQLFQLPEPVELARTQPFRLLVPSRLARAQSFQNTVPFGLARTQSFQALVPLRFARTQ